MNNPRLAARYAKSLMDLATEKNQIDAVYADMKWLQKICKSNPDFVSVLRSPVIKSDKKAIIINAVITDRVAELTTAFIQLLVRKTRESNLSEIVNAFIEQFNALRNIHTVKITAASPISDELKESIMVNVKSAIKANSFEIETAVNDELIGGFILETGGQMVDASILKDLKDIRKQFLNNDYIQKIR